MMGQAEDQSPVSSAANASRARGTDNHPLAIACPVDNAAGKPSNDADVAAAANRATGTDAPFHPHPDQPDDYALAAEKSPAAR